jgi:hypothetical protein
MPFPFAFLAYSLCLLPPEVPDSSKSRRVPATLDIEVHRLVGAVVAFRFFYLLHTPDIPQSHRGIHFQSAELMAATG